MFKVLVGNYYPNCGTKNVLAISVFKSRYKQSPLTFLQIRRTLHDPKDKDCQRHLICLSDWENKRIMEVMKSAITLKKKLGDTHGKQLDILKDRKIMILESHNEPILRMSVSKGASMLGASDVHILAELDWEHDFLGKVFSEMADTIFVTSHTHACLRRFAHYSTVPVISSRSRKHASVQSLATIMSILEDYEELRNLNVAYVGPPHQVLNDYLLMCPKFGANLKFKCCCASCPVSPLVLEDSKFISKSTSTKVKQSTITQEALKDADVVIAGPSPRKQKIPDFMLTVETINKNTKKNWTYYHTFPRGPEADDKLFFHKRAKTFNAFRNLQFISAALIVHLLNCKCF